MTGQPERAFGARLRAAMDERGPFCVGIDPHPRLLDEWGLTDSLSGLEQFALGATEALAARVAVLKPQSAFFERHGAAGIAVLEKVVATAKQAGALVLLDVKRGDIGSTSQAYADAYLDPRSPLSVDAITVSPFLGFGSLDPMIDCALKHDAGVFVLARTSNPEAAEVQQATVHGGGTVTAAVLRRLAALNQGAAPMGSFGAVVGATGSAMASGTGEDLLFNGPILAPGVGAQGGSPDSVREIFAAVLPQVLPSSSREILAGGPSATGLIEAANRSIDAFRALLAP